CRHYRCSALWGVAPPPRGGVSFLRWRRLRLCGGGLLLLAVWCGILERTIVVRRGGGWGWRRSRSRGWHFRRWYAAPILVEENSVHSTIQSAMDCRDWHIGFDQFLIL